MFLTLPNRSMSGFTLIEMLITVAIVGILAAITIPTYQGSIQISRRGEAKSELLHLAQLEAKWRLSHTTYGSLSDILGGSTAYNDFVAKHPDYSFDVDINTSTPNDPFTITAAPNNGQTNDNCGTLAIGISTNIFSSTNATDCPVP